MTGPSPFSEPETRIFKSAGLSALAMVLKGRGGKGSNHVSQEGGPLWNGLNCEKRRKPIQESPIFEKGTADRAF